MPPCGTSGAPVRMGRRYQLTTVTPHTTSSRPDPGAWCLVVAWKMRKGSGDFSFRFVTCRTALEDHRLGLEEREQPFGSPLASYPRLLEATERHSEISTECVVADRARAQLPGYVAGPVHIVGEHRGVQSVDRVVGDGDGVLLVVGGDDAEDRAEYLLLSDGGGVVDVPEHRRLDVPATVQVLRATAAGGEGRPLGEALCDVALDPVPLAPRRQRARSESGDRTGPPPGPGRRTGSGRRRIRRAGSG